MYFDWQRDFGRMAQERPVDVQHRCRQANPIWSRSSRFRLAVTVPAVAWLDIIHRMMFDQADDTRREPDRIRARV